MSKGNSFRGVSDYNIGLDIGTNSVGWAVVDPIGNFFKFKGRTMGGVVLIHQKGEPAASRRSFRSSRRRLQRKKNRIRLVQELMGEMVLKDDPNFFLRMKYSYVSKEDNEIGIDYSTLFDNNYYSFKELYEKYPTIFHLRKELATADHKMDIRFIYLAIHHIVKYRGNFLYDGDISINNLNLKDSIVEMLEEMIPESEESFILQLADRVNAILSDSSTVNSKKKELLVSEFNNIEIIDKEKRKKWAKALALAITGSTFDLANLFEISKSTQISLSEEIDEEKLSELSDEDYIKLELLKKVCSGYTLFRILSIDVKNEQDFTISDAYISQYERHKYELQTLKGIYNSLREGKYFDNFCSSKIDDYISEYKNLSKDQVLELMKDDFKRDYIEKYREKYKTFFSKTDGKYNNYAQYIKSEIPGKTGKTTNDLLIKTIKNELDEIERDLNALGVSDPRVEECRNRIENGCFLLKPRNSNNGAIPNQFHVEELKKILDNQAKYYPELDAIKTKLIQIASFRIPYSVGPLVKGPFAWMERKEGMENKKIYPWNFEEVVDVDKSSLKFIKEMTNHCTYLESETEVLPKFSLLYSEYCIFNELANITVNGHSLEADCKNAAFEELFKKIKTVKKNTFIKWYCSKYKVSKEDCIFKGFSDDEQFTSTYGSFIDLEKILGSIDSDEKRETAEDIIEYVTVFNDKKVIERMILKKHPDITIKQMESIKKLKYVGWGRLSKKLLTGIYVKDDLGMPHNIMDYLKSTSGKNLVSIIYSYKFIDVINDLNKDALDEIRDNVKDYIHSEPLPPAVKKGVWVAYKVVNEIEKVMGKPPLNIYIETTRTEEKKKEVSTQRYKNLEKMYQDALKKGDDSYKEVMDELQSYKSSDKKKELSKESLYLYFLQNGRCLYSGKRLDINSLPYYEVDHIIPRCYMKDDSLSNKALVIRAENQRKLDKMLIDPDTISKWSGWWKQLLDAGMMSQTKYDNLCRTEFTDDDLKGFERRQIVETSQIVKEVIKIFKAIKTETRTYGVSARFTSNIKDHINLPKIRDLNDFHHVHDAYVAALAGDFLKKRLSNEIFMSVYREIKSQPDFKEECKYGIFAELFYTDVYGFYSGTHKKTQIMDCVYNTHDFFVNALVEEQTGLFYNQTILKKGCGAIPQKENMSISLYGGKGGESDAYFSIVKYTKKKKEQRSLVGIPIRIVALSKTRPTAIEDYIKEHLGIDAFEYVTRRILKYQFMKVQNNGKTECYYLVGEDERINAKQLWLSKTSYQVLDALFDDSVSQDEFYKRFNQEKQEKMFDELCSKVASEYPYYEKFIKEFYSHRDIYFSLKNTVASPKQAQAAYMKQLLKATKADSQRVDKIEIVDISIPKKTRMNGKTVKLDDTKFYSFSITGMFSKEI